MAKIESTTHIDVFQQDFKQAPGGESGHDADEEKARLKEAVISIFNSPDGQKNFKKLFSPEF